MPQFQVILHVEEPTQQSAEEWLQRAKAVLKENEAFLVSPSTGSGKWCEGHVMPAQSTSTASPEPPRVLQMGPRN